MRPVEPRRTRRTAPKDAERREVESCLARWGLLRRPRPLSATPGRTEGFGRGLRGALEELGPVFSAFGLYLAARIDLLAAADCLELATLPGAVPPLASLEFQERIAAELGRPAGAVLAAMEPEPLASRLLVQAHRARLADGQPVLLRLVRSDLAGAVERDLERLPLLAPAFAVQGWSEAALQGVIADFAISLRQGADLGGTAEALTLLAADAEGFGLIVPPGVYRDLSTSRLLTVEDPGGLGLGEAAGAAVAWGPARGRELARLIAVAWLRQALLGAVFPVDLREAGVRVLDSGRAAFLAGAFSRPLAPGQSSLRGFLIALACREPDDACSYLLREMSGEPGASEEALRLQMRQIVPFRDGAWSASGESLAEQAFVCARQAHACGFRPRPSLMAFYRGLASVAATCRLLVPDRDALLEALQEVRVLSSFAQVREAMSPQWNDQWARYALLMSELPRKMDELLTLAAEGKVGTASPETIRPPRRAERSHLLLGASVMVLGSLALVLQYFVRTGAFAGQEETFAAILFLAVGATLLGVLARTR